MTLSHASTKSRTNFGCPVVTGIDFGDGSELGIRAEDEVDRGAGPLDVPGFAVVTLVHVLGRGHAPMGAHVKQVHEEVVAQRFGLGREDPELGVVGIGTQHAQPTDQHGHLRSRQPQQARSVDEQLLGPALVARSQIVSETISGRLENGESVDIGLLG